MSTMTESLRLIVTGDSKGAQRALDEIAGKATSTQSKMNHAANVAAVGFVALGAVIGKSVKDYGDFAIQVAKVSAQTDMSTEATSRFLGQMQMLHVDTSKAGMVMKTMETAIYGLETGTKKSVDTFKILGLTWADLKGLKPEDQIGLIRDRLSEVRDPAARAAAAQALLGRGAKDMSLWYTASSDSIAAINKNLQANGRIMNSADMAQAKKAAEAWKELQSALIGVEFTIARTVIPDLGKLAHIITGVVQAVRPWTPLLVPLTIALGTFVAVVKTAVFFQKTWNQLLGLLPSRHARQGEGGGRRASREQPSARPEP
jgi:hypothetical protein